MPLALSFPALTRLARWPFIALAIAIPLSTALDNVLLAILLILVLIGGSGQVFHNMVQNPVARASVLLFAMLALGMMYGAASLKEAVDILGKYVDLAFIPLMMVVAHDTNTQRRVLQTFLTIMMATALLSWMVGLGILPVAKWMWIGCLPENPAIFRGSITQNMLMAYAVYLLILQVCMASIIWKKWALIALAVFSSSSVLFMVQGKTGYLILLGLLLYFAWIMLAQKLRDRGRSIGWKELIGIGLIGLILAVAAYQASPRLHDRVDQAVNEFQLWHPNVQKGHSSTGERLEFYYNTFGIIKQHPWLGIGTGGFPAAYAQQVQGMNLFKTNNPHNEFLMVTVQTGILGFVLLLYLFYTQWHFAARLPSSFERDAARGLVLTMVITSLFNSPLHDHTEGVFFAFASALLFVNLGSDKRYG